jgi:hypothetical protein
MIPAANVISGRLDTAYVALTLIVEQGISHMLVWLCLPMSGPVVALLVMQTMFWGCVSDVVI